MASEELPYSPHLARPHIQARTRAARAAPRGGEGGGGSLSPHFLLLRIHRRQRALLTTLVNCKKPDPRARYQARLPLDDGPLRPCRTGLLQATSSLESGRTRCGSGAGSGGDGERALRQPRAYSFPPPAGATHLLQVRCRGCPKLCQQGGGHGGPRRPISGRQHRGLSLRSCGNLPTIRPVRSPSGHLERPAIQTAGDRLQAPLRQRTGPQPVHRRIYGHLRTHDSASAAGLCFRHTYPIPR